MRSFSLGNTTFIQGLYTSMWLLVLFDVASPTFDLAGLSIASWPQAIVWGAVLLTASVALGVVMHTLSRSLFHWQKQSWALDILTSESVQARFRDIPSVERFPGGPTYTEILDEDTADRSMKAGGLFHHITYSLMARSPDLYNRTQVYRYQYRLARAFVVPSAAFAVTLPFWAPVAALDTAGSIGPFPIIRSQLFLLALLAAIVSYMAFRERSYRYYAAQALAFVTLEGLAREE